MNEVRRRENSSTKIHFDEARALSVFATCGEWYRERRGFYARLVPPQQAHTPPAVRKDPVSLGAWFSCAAVAMRGGINSEAAFIFLEELYTRSPFLFTPEFASGLTVEEFVAEVRATARAIHNNGRGSFGKKQAGTLSYKLEEHADAWIENAAALTKCWRGDVREIFRDVATFEEAYARVRSERGPERPENFSGMQRKIFSLLALWLQEFGLIRSLPLPLIVDFHANRLLLQQRVVVPQWEPLGEGRSKEPALRRPANLAAYPAVHVTKEFVGKVIAWSLEFLARHCLSAHDVSHGVWFLSRELCASYFGNRSFTKEVETGDGRKLRRVQRFVDPARLATVDGWPKQYRDPCALCPVESTCALAIPNGSYYDWGRMVNAGPHVSYPGRAYHPLLLPGIDWRGFPSSFPSGKQKHR